jgi:cysteine-rich repeat protein
VERRTSLEDLALTTAQTRAVVCGALLASADALSAGRARADEVTVAASMDTTLYEQDGALSNARGTRFFVGLTGTRSRRRALLAFDIARALPPGAKVREVELRVLVSRGQLGAVDIALHRMLKPWGEAGSRASGGEGGGGTADVGDATWTHQRWPSAPWDSPGGDFAAPASTRFTVDALGPYSATGSGLVNDVQAFLDDPERNYGWVLVGDDDPGSVAKRFESRENAGAAGPTLVITYDPPAVPVGACCASDGGCSVTLDPGTSCAGDYRGAGTSCGPDACPPPVGACCQRTAAATCTPLTQVACGGTGTWLGGGASCEPNPCPVVLTPFVDPLPLPAPARPVAGSAGRAASYRLRAVQRSQQLHRDLPPTKVWGYADDDGAGGYPGPTIEARSGEPVDVEWVNDLRSAGGAPLTEHALPVDTCLHGAHDSSPRTVVHLHGGVVPSEFDGQPEATLLPGEHTRYSYPNDQVAATLWYHDHAVGITRLNVIMGLAGFYLVRDDAEDALGLPAGEFEVPLAIQDRSFWPDGQFRYPERWQESFFGDVPVVNGKVAPYLEVARGKYRLRLLNGSTSRTYTLSMSDGRPFMQIGSDGGLLPKPVAAGKLTLAPGERADVVVDFEFAEADVILRNSAPAPYPVGGEAVLDDIMKFVITDRPGHRRPLPKELAKLTAPRPDDAVLTRELVLDRAESNPCGDAAMWMINGLEWHDVTEQPRLGTSELWRFVNRTGISHPMHLHGLFFRVLSRQRFRVDGERLVTLASPAAPPRSEQGWKDTVRVDPFETVELLASFDDFPGRFPYHCHLIEHEDHGMMRQYEALAVCGDGALARRVEACDDGNTTDGDGCSAQCEVEPADAGALSPSGGAAGRQGGGCGVGNGGAGGHALLLLCAGTGWSMRRRRRGERRR